MLLNTRFYVDKTFCRQMFLDKLSDWLSCSNDYALPDIVFDFDQEEAVLVSVAGDQKLTIYNFEDRFAVSLVVDSGGATDTINFVLDDKSENPSLQLSQNRVFNTISSENDRRRDVNLPDVLRNIFWDEYGCYDSNIMTDNRPLLVRKDMIEFAADILLQKKIHI